MFVLSNTLLLARTSSLKNAAPAIVTEAEFRRTEDPSDVFSVASVSTSISPLVSMTPVTELVAVPPTFSSASTVPT